MRHETSVIFQMIKETKTDSDNRIRIARFLSLCGLASRRKCEDIIFEGRVKINGATVKDPAVKVSEKDKIEVDGRIIAFEKKMVLALNKPAGYICTVSDKFKRKTVIDLVREEKYRLYPVGRLDTDSRGLLILTNDGELANKVMHPKYGVPKVYEIAIKGEISKNDFNHVKQGIRIEGRYFQPLKLELLGYSNKEKNSLLMIKIDEGRKRIIRKAFSKLGYRVIDLKRVQIGCLKLGDLREGSYRILGDDEIKILLKS